MAGFVAAVAAPEQRYTRPGEAPFLGDLAHGTAEEAAGARVYWGSPRFPRPEDSTLLFPTAIATEEDYAAHEEMIFGPRAADKPFPWEAVPARPAGRGSGTMEMLAAHAARIAAGASVPVYQQRLRDPATAAEALRNTVAILDHVAHTGVYVRIKDGCVAQFVPFLQWGRKNDWGPWLASQVHRRDGTVSGFLERFRRVCGWAPGPDATAPADQWMLAGACIGIEDSAGRTVNARFAEFGHMLAEACAAHRVADVEFVFNKRDLPMAPADGTSSPQFHMWNNFAHPLPPALQADCRTGAGLVPVLSMSTRNGFADMLVPSEDDWRMVTQCSFRNAALAPADGSWIASSRVPWAKRVGTAVFRGTATGAGTTAVSGKDPNAVNQRLALAKIAYDASVNPRHNGALGGGPPLLDAGITGFNCRPKKSFQTALDVVEMRRMPFNKVPPMDYKAQGRHKYVVYVDGHSAANRLGWMLLSGCCILMVESRFGFRGWLHDGMEPNVHFVPVAADMSDLLAQVRWCRDNDAAARTIAENARALGELVMSRGYIRGYMAHLLNALAPPGGLELI